MLKKSVSRQRGSIPKLYPFFFLIPSRLTFRSHATTHLGFTSPQAQAQARGLRKVYLRLIQFASPFINLLSFVPVQVFHSLEYFSEENLACAVPILNLLIASSARSHFSVLTHVLDLQRIL